MLKNYRFNNKRSHKYDLHSKTTIDNTPYLIAKDIFDPTYSTNHIYWNDRKKETLDSLLASLQGNTWKQSLRNN